MNCCKKYRTIIHGSLALSKHNLIKELVRIHFIRSNLFYHTRHDLLTLHISAFDMTNSFALQFFRTFMNILTLNTFLHTPCCPKIFPQNSPCTQIQKGNFSLQTPDRLDQGSVLTNYFSLESQHHENELENMGRILVNEEEDTTMNGKRSFEEFMGKKNHRASIFRALTLLQNGRKPCKRALF